MKKSVHHFNPENVSSINDLLDEFAKTGVFGGGNLGKAKDILFKAKADGAKVFLSLAGAMVPGGMRKVITTAIKSGMIDLIVTTGANITHDLIEAFGVKHLQRVDAESDQELRERGIDRVYNAFVPETGFPNFEDNIKILIDEFYETKNKEGQLITSSHEFLSWLGPKLKDDESIVKVASQYSVPIFVPVIADSVLGLQIWLRSQFKTIIVDEMRDLEVIQNYFHDSEKTLALIAGGGVPKNYMLQSSLMSDKDYQYGIAITMDRVETGGLSGATLTEAVSWGKLTWESPKVTVYSDVTIVLPLLVTAWVEESQHKK